MNHFICEEVFSIRRYKFIIDLLIIKYAIYSLVINLLKKKVFFSCSNLLQKEAYYNLVSSRCQGLIGGGNLPLADTYLMALAEGLILYKCCAHYGGQAEHSHPLLRFDIISIIDTRTTTS